MVCYLENLPFSRCFSAGLIDLSLASNSSFKIINNSFNSQISLENVLANRVCKSVGNVLVRTGISRKP